MKIWKEIIPGSATVTYMHPVTGEPEKATFTPEYNKYLCDQGNAMIKAGVPIPVPVEHQDINAKVMTPAEQAADETRNNAGFVDKYAMRGPKLWSLVDIKDPDIAKKLPNTIPFVSPHINTFTDGNGKKWEGVISHVALTTRPRIMGQEPFPQNVAASLSVLGKLKETRLTPNHVNGELLSKGFSFSRAGFLVVEDKKLRPMFPAAFSLLTGVKLSEKEFKEVEKEEVEEEGEGEKPPEAKKEGEGKPPEMEGDKERKSPLDETDDAEGMCDLSYHELIGHLLKANGFKPPEGMTEETFERDLYETLMAKVYELGAKQQEPAPEPRPDPTQTRKPDMGRNPIVQESPPMYASMAEIEKITDPKEKILAQAYFSLQQETAKLRSEREVDKAAIAENKKLAEDNKRRADAAAFSILEGAKTKRQERINKVMAKLPQKNREMLKKMLSNASMSLSLADTGAVIDPMSEHLEFAESIADSIPDILQPGAKFHVEDQPSDGQMTDQQADEILDKVYRVPATAKK